MRHNREFREKILCGFIFGTIFILYVIWYVNPAKRGWTEPLRTYDRRLQQTTNDLNRFGLRQHLQRQQVLEIFPGSDYEIIARFKPEIQIPHILHQQWKTNYVPRTFQAWITSWHHNTKGWQHLWWTDENIHDFLNRKFSYYADYFKDNGNTLYFESFKTLAMRYLFLYHYGGVYADIDMESLRPLDDLVQKYPCIISYEPVVHSYLYQGINYTIFSNSFIACRPKHPFLQVIVNHLLQNTNTSDASQMLGTKMLEKTVQLYNQRNPYPLAEDKLHIISSDLILPTYAGNDSTLVKIRSLCKDVHEKVQNYRIKLPQHIDLTLKQEKICQWLKLNNYINKPSPLSYTLHHWLFPFEKPTSYTGESHDSNNVNIHEIVEGTIDPSVIMPIDT